MITPWTASVKKTQQLTVFPTDTVTKGPWGSVFTSAIQEFNRLSTTMKLGVTLVVSQTPPDTKSIGGANVQFDALNGSASYTVLGKDLKSSSVDGSGLSALTEPVRWQRDNGDKELIKAFIFMPLAPTITAVKDAKASKTAQRDAGDPVKLFIAVHEFVHACGLDNHDHSPETAPDVFVGQPQPEAGAMDKPDDDRLRLRLDPKLTAPPIFLTTRTAGLIQKNWQ
jgi:hypothetical protein